MYGSGALLLELLHEHGPRSAAAPVALIHSCAAARRRTVRRQARVRAAATTHDACHREEGETRTRSRRCPHPSIV
jgi:hypothetical protein